METNTELIGIANRLKKAFILEKGKASKRPYRPDPRYDRREWWERTAKVVKGMNAVPEEFMSAQFLYSQSPVFANTLYGKTAISRYYKYLEGMGAAIQGQETSTVSATAEELRVELQATLQTLRLRCGSTDLFDAPVITTLIKLPELFHPLAVMCIYGADPRISIVYKSRALPLYQGNPMIREAMEVLNLSTENLL